MAEIKKIRQDRIIEIAAEHGFNPEVMLNDYYVTAILYLLRDVKSIYFKGGTALQKIFLDYSRLSEDADFTIERDINDVTKEIRQILESAKLFDKITKDKDVEGFTRLVAHYKGYPKDGTVFIDLNQRAKILMKPEAHALKHFYKDEIPEFKIKTLAKEEMIAEKIAAAMGRNKPRDHFDLYKAMQAKMPINMGLAKKKCKQSGIEFNILKMFSNANKLKTRWDEDLVPLLAEEISFEEVMKMLAKHFKLKEEKENIRRLK